MYVCVWRREGDGVGVWVGGEGVREWVRVSVCVSMGAGESARVVIVVVVVTVVVC